MPFTDYIYCTAHGSNHFSILYLQSKVQQRRYKKSQFHTTFTLIQKLSHLPKFIGDPLFDLGCLCLHLFGVL